MKIDLQSHTRLRELARSGMIRLQDFDVDIENAPQSLDHSITRAGGTVLLVVDHSHFTAKQTRFEIFGNESALIVAEILQIVRDEVISMQSKTVSMLASVNAAVINSLDDNEIVDNVLREVMHVLPHSDAGVFRLFDEDSGYLVPVSYDGLPDDYRDYRLQPNESVSGEVFTTGRPSIHNGRQNIIDAHRVMRPENQSFMERSQISNALLCVPVMAEGKRLGTLTTLCFSRDGAFSAFDREVLESLAAQVAIAYQRSLAYKNALATSDRLEAMRSDLARKNAELDRAVQLHDTLLRIFSTSGGLHDQLAMVAKLFNVEFRFENVLGMDYHSSNWSSEREVLQQVVEVAEAPVGYFHFDASGDASFHGALFGTLAAFVALDFVGDMSRVNALNASKKAYFQDLAEGIEGGGLRSQFGFRPDRFSQILVATPPGERALVGTQLALHRHEVELLNVSKLTNALVFHDREQIVILFSTATVSALEKNLAVLSEAISSVGVCVGVSDVYEQIDLQSAAYAQATNAAACLLRRGRPGLLTHRDMGIEILLSGRDRQDILRFTRQVLDPLLSDQKHRVLYQTLFHYVHEGKSARRTAETLEIHTNTLYQRLARIEALTGRNIADAADFTLLSVACQLHVAYAD
jgi:hypothetical protein